jgi:diguanylate cyclase (GGDEF)-like protein
MSPKRRSLREPDREVNTRVRILAVDDEPMNLELVERALRQRYEVVAAPDPHRALDVLRDNHGDDNKFALILTDYRMPGMNGAELLAESIQFNPDAKRVIVTGYAEVDSIIASIDSGQIHYVVKKPWNTRELERIINHLVLVYQLEQENRSLLDQLHVTNERLREQERLLSNRRGQPRAAANQVKTVNSEVDLLAYKDPLTGLYGHRAFQERLGEELARAQRYRNPLGLVLIDIDRFRTLNNEIGYQAGDEILRRVAELLRSKETQAGLRDSDIVARFGGEEFIILLPETNKAGAATKAERLRGAIAEHSFPTDTSITISLGVASFPADAETADDLLAAAARALRRAKAKGRDQVKVCGDDDDDETTGERSPDKANERKQRASSSSSAPERTEYAPGNDGEHYPTYHQYMLSIIECLEVDRAISCLYVDLGQLRRIEREYGINKHAEVFLNAGRLLDAMRGDTLRLDDIVCRTDDGEAYLCFLSAARVPDGQGAPRDLETIATQMQDRLEQALASDIQDLIHDYPRVTVGYSRVLNNTMIGPERLISRLVSEAESSAELMRKRNAQRDKTRLQEIILNDRLVPVCQPIVHLGTGDVFGFEALTRGPAATPMESPMALFSVADEVGLTFELDRACFRNALRGAVGLEPIHRLFINLLPLSFYDSNFVEREVGGLLDAAALTPANVVFEITERLAIENFASFRRALAGYTAMGFGVAIDDVGTRHSNLESVMALRPHFIKISDVLTRGVSRSMVKREMLRSLGNIAETIDAVVVAEGIETFDDLEVLRELRIHYGQGFLMARPGPPFPPISESVRAQIQKLNLTSFPKRPLRNRRLSDDPEFGEGEDSTTGVRRRVALPPELAENRRSSAGDLPLPMPAPPESPAADSLGGESSGSKDDSPDDPGPRPPLA